MAKTLVTGGTGFIGSHVVRQLDDRGDELRLLVTHGTLHVCGWDHAEPQEEAAMRALEQRLLAEGR